MSLPTGADRDPVPLETCVTELLGGLLVQLARDTWLGGYWTGWTDGYGQGLERRRQS